MMSYILNLACIISIIITPSKQTLLDYGESVGDLNILHSGGCMRKLTLKENFKFWDKNFTDFLRKLLFL